MPAQKRSYDTSPTPPPPDEKDDDSLQDNQNHDEEADDGDGNSGNDSDGTTCSSGDENNEFITVRLSEIRKEVQCPICLGIIRKTRTVMECLHRFCRECIDKSMRMGNNECPACRTHCASRRSLRDDPNYDALIALLYPDIDKYEEEVELAFHEEEKARNKLIQASIAQTLRRQSEALGRKRSARTTGAFPRRSQGSHRSLRGRRSFQGAEHQISDEEDGNHDVSSADEHSTEVKPKRYKRRVGRPSLASAASDENDAEINQDSPAAVAYTGLIRCSEIPAWGKGGIRSNNRHGSLGGGTGKFSRNSRISKLVEHLCRSDENEVKLEVRLMLVSLSEEDIPSLQRPYLCCQPTMEVKHLSQYVALQTSIEVGEIDIVLIKELNPTDNPSSSEILAIPKPVVGDPSKVELHTVKEHQTLAEIQETCGFSQRNLVLAYRRKSKNRTDHDEGKVVTM